MNNRSQRIEIFDKLDKEVKSGVYAHLDINNAEIVDLSKLKSCKQVGIPTINFLNQTTIHNIEEDSLALVFISAKNAGGGVLSGSKAQEEDISLRTTWYYHIKNVKGFYLPQGASAINSDNMLYAKNAYLLKDEYYNSINPYNISLLGVAAPNLNGMLSQSQKVDEKQIYQVLGNRIENILKFATSRNKRRLILGAWGCGVFGLDANKVSLVLNEKIKEGWYVGEIDFCIPSQKVLEIFKKNIS